MGAASNQTTGGPYRLLRREFEPASRSSSSSAFNDAKPGPRRRRGESLEAASQRVRLCGFTFLFFNILYDVSK